MTRIFLTHNRSALHHYYGDRAYDLLSSLGEVRFHDSNDDTSAEDIIAQATDCEILVSFRIPPIDASLMKALPKLAAICRVAVDIRNIDLESANRLGILVTRASPGFGPSVSEWIIGNMINLARHIPQAFCAYQDGIMPVQKMGTELRGSTLGIIGYGTIGKALARLAQAFGMQILVNDPYATVPQDSGMRQSELEPLLTDSDFVVCLAPVTPETMHLIDISRLRLMRKSAYFINASRAELVNEEDLRQALDDGLIAGCALDVGSAKDQTPPLALAGHPKIIATPHIGGLTPQAAEHQAMDSVRQVEALLSGRVPECSVNARYATRARERFGLTLP